MLYFLVSTLQCSFIMVSVNIRLNKFGVMVLCCMGVIIFFYAVGGPSLFQSEPKVSLKNLLCVSIDLTQAGGAKVRAVHESNSKAAVAKGLTDEGAKELVSEGDKQSHRAMYYGFEKAFPGIMIRSEEHDIGPIHLSRISDPSSTCPDVDAVIPGDYWVPLRDVTVWIDPLDATQEYTENLTEYVSVMACIVVNNRPLVGVIYRPFIGDTHWALVGYGSNLINDADRRKTVPSSSTTRPDWRFVISRSHSSAKTKQLLETAYGDNSDNDEWNKGSETKTPGSHGNPALDIVEAGGAAYKALAVINGSYDAYVHWSTIKLWDVCAAEALVTSVGGQATDIEGNQIVYDVRGDAKIKRGFLLAKHKHSDIVAQLGKAMEKIKNQQQKSEALQQTVKSLS